MLLLIDDETLLDAASGLERCGVSVALIVERRQDGIFVRGAAGASWGLTHPPMTCLGVVTLDADRSELDALMEWGQSGGATDLRVVALSRNDSPDDRRRAIADCVIEGLARIGAEISAEYRSVLEQNRQLRSAYEALQSSFDRLEQFMVSNRLQAPILHYEAEPAAHWAPAAGATVLRQTLPILSPQFSFLELNLRRVENNASNDIVVRLLLEPSGRILGEWNLSAAKLADGWNAFRPSPSVEAPNEIVLEVVWPAETPGVKIGLANRRWNAPPLETDAPQIAPEGGFAMRIWSGLPGVRAAEAETDAGRTNDRLSPLAPIELLRATEHDYAGRKLRRGARAVLALEGRLLVHPFGAEPTIAALPHPLPEGATYVSVEGRTDEDRASPIAYALAVLPPGVAPETVFLSAGRPGPAFSGWRVLEPWRPERIQLALPEPTKGDERLYLATRLPLGSSGSFAWATWRGVMLGRGPTPDGSLEAQAAGRSPATGQISEPILWKGGWRTPLDLLLTHSSSARSAFSAARAAIGASGSRAGRRGR